ncbi:MAG TPA: LysM peptidoglycan-binding domain-containing protein [Acidimicrobiales bacterium]|nr:LysM peptidoglycan-binding domain-containing protein [Acidimicrobiales bacterium]
MSDRGIGTDRSLGSSAWRWARALPAAVALLALVAGVPLALLAWGDWPITGLPSGEQIRELPSTVASDSAIIAVFTVALWVAWALFVACVVVEAAAEVRGRDVGWHVPAGPIQHLARGLVATVAMTLGSLGPVAAGPLRTPPVRETVTAGTPVVAPAAPAPVAHVAPAPASPSEPPRGTTVTVAPGDTPWELAEQHLGDGARWTEIWHANRGRAQPDGRTWDHPDVLMPGWQLALPGVGEAPGPLVPGVGQVRTVVVEPDDNPWSLAERHLGDGARWRELFALNRGRPQPGGTAWVTQNHIEPGWTIELPAPPVAGAVPAPAPPASGETPAADVPAGGVPGTNGTDAGAAADEPAPAVVPAGDEHREPWASVPAQESAAGGVPAGDEHREPPAASAPDDEGATLAPGRAPEDGTPPGGPGGPGGGAPPLVTSTVNDAQAIDEGSDEGAADAGGDGLDIAPVAVAGVSALLAAGVVLHLDAHRRRRMRRRPRGADGPDGPGDLAAVERRWRAIADHETAEWVDTAIRYLTWAVRSRGSAVTVVGARVGPGGLSLLLGEPAPEGAPGFVPVREGWEWSLSCDDLDEIRALAADEMPYTPGLVTLGTTEDGSTVLVDVEQLGLTSVEGDRAVVRSWLTAVALDVATAPWASEVDLRLVGGLTDLATLDQVSVLPAGEVAEAVRRAASATGRALGVHPSTQHARAGHAAEPWPPLTVIVSSACVDQALVETVSPGRGAAVIAVGPIPRAAHRLAAGADGFATLFPYRLTVRLCAVDAQLASDTARLLSSSASGAEAPVPAAAPAAPAPASATRFAPVAAAPPPVPDDVRATYTALTQAILRPGEVEVVLLGSPRVSGWASEPRQRSVEIVCYLAAHDAPVTGERLRDSIFPPGFKPASLREAISRTRTALGRAVDGEPHMLPATREGTYALGPSVRSDLQRFQALLAAARQAPAACEVELLRTALALVRGQPFSDCPPGGYGWAGAEGISYALERMIVDTAQRLNELAFAAGDARLAEWASRQGQRAVPGHEGLYCDLALAKLHQDDVDGFTSVRREAEASAAAFDALDGLQPETHEFFNRVLAQYMDVRDAAQGG